MSKQTLESGTGNAGNTSYLSESANNISTTETPREIALSSKILQEVEAMEPDKEQNTPVEYNISFSDSAILPPLDLPLPPFPPSEEALPLFPDLVPSDIPDEEMGWILDKRPRIPEKNGLPVFPPLNQLALSFPIWEENSGWANISGDSEEEREGGLKENSDNDTPKTEEIRKISYFLKKPFKEVASHLRNMRFFHHKRQDATFREREENVGTPGTTTVGTIESSVETGKKNSDAGVRTDEDSVLMEEWISRELENEKEERYVLLGDEEDMLPEKGGQGNPGVGYKSSILSGSEDEVENTVEPVPEKKTGKTPSPLSLRGMLTIILKGYARKFKPDKHAPGNVPEVVTSLHMEGSSTEDERDIEENNVIDNVIEENNILDEVREVRQEERKGGHHARHLPRPFKSFVECIHTPQKQQRKDGIMAPR